MYHVLDLWQGAKYHSDDQILEDFHIPTSQFVSVCPLQVDQLEILTREGFKLLLQELLLPYGSSHRLHYSCRRKKNNKTKKK